MVDHKIMVLGANGMLGNAVYRYFHEHHTHKVVGIVRSKRSFAEFPNDLRDTLAEGGDVGDSDTIERLFDTHRPTIVVNCIGLVKQIADSKNPLSAIPLNSV